MYLMLHTKVRAHITKTSRDFLSYSHRQNKTQQTTYNKLGQTFALVRKTTTM